MHECTKFSIRSITGEGLANVTYATMFNGIGITNKVKLTSNWETHSIRDTISLRIEGIENYRGIEVIIHSLSSTIKSFENAFNRISIRFDNNIVWPIYTNNCRAMFNHCIKVDLSNIKFPNEIYNCAYMLAHIKELILSRDFNIPSKARILTNMFYSTYVVSGPLNLKLGKKCADIRCMFAYTKFKSAVRINLMLNKEINNLSYIFSNSKNIKFTDFGTLSNARYPYLHNLASMFESSGAAEIPVKIHRDIVLDSGNIARLNTPSSIFYGNMKMIKAL